MPADIRLEFISSSVYREPGQPPAACPPSDWDALRTMSKTVLKELGLRPWNDPMRPDDDDPPVFRTHTLWLFPWEWHRHIPDGFELIGLHGESFKFKREGNDARFGCLAYGILIKEDDDAR